MAEQTKDGFSVFEDIGEFADWEDNVLVTDAPPRAMEEKMPPVMTRTDIVGRILDGEDFILNNPPGFAIAAAMEYQREHDLDAR